MGKIDLLLTWAVGLLFASALSGKLTDPCWSIQQIQATLQSLGLGPWGGLLRNALVFAEATTSVLLFALPRCRIVTSSCLVLLLLFTVVLARQGLQQGFGAGCACGGKSSALPVWGALLRNVLAMTALFVARRLQSSSEVRA